MKSSDLSKKDKEFIWHPYTSLEDGKEYPVITSAKGVYLFTDKGEQLIDAISSWWVNLHGHCNDYISSALANQANKLEHVIFAGFTHEPGIQLAERLLQILPGNQHKIFYSDNGSTAVEAGIKLAAQHWYNQGINKTKILAIEGAFHGDTFGAMSAGERGAFSKPFQPMLFDAEFIEFPFRDREDEVLRNFEKICEDKEIFAFIYEPLIQGAAGMRMYSPEVLDKMIRVAKENDIICIADEVFTGFGRTGKLFASEYMREKPDIICLSKGLTGGYLPMGVTACNEKIVKSFSSPDPSKTFFHGHSYTGNPLCCAVALASLDLLLKPECQAQRALIENKHRLFQDQIKSFKSVKGVRVLGTILALEFNSTESTGYFNSLRDLLYHSFIQKKVLIRPLGNTIYILPPYIITEKELDLIYQAITEVVEKLV